MASVPKPMQRGRRLFELLEEQQEPFLLDVYLLEHGYSDRALKDEARSACSPVDACLRCLGGYGFKMRRGGILRCVVQKIVGSRLRRMRASSMERAAQGSARWLAFLFEMGCTCKSAAEFRRLSYSDVIGGNELDSEAQHSPMSVFHLHSDEDSPVHHHIHKDVLSNSGLKSLGERKEAVSWGDLDDFLSGSPPSSRQGDNSSSAQFSKSDHLLVDCIHELEEQLWRSALCLSPRRIGPIMEEEILSWDNQRGGLTNICKLIELDLTKSKKEWSHFQHDIIEIGVEIETKIFEEVRNETLMDMMCHCTLQQ